MRSYGRWQGFIVRYGNELFCDNMERFNVMFLGDLEEHTILRCDIFFSLLSSSNPYKRLQIFDRFSSLRVQAMKKCGQTTSICTLSELGRGKFASGKWLIVIVSASV